MEFLNIQITINMKRRKKMERNKFSLAITAIVTPFKNDGSIDWETLQKNIAFQFQEGINGIVAAGTTGESATLSQQEHIAFLKDFKRIFQEVKLSVIRETSEESNNLPILIGGCGSNCTEEAIAYTKVAFEAGYGCALLVDCYYNGPSSLELRENYYRIIAKKFPNFPLIPYIIPGRTGCALSPGDLATLVGEYPNFVAVKEASGDLSRMREIRTLLPCFPILSGDDNKTFELMTSLSITASGVISVISNIAPNAVQLMCNMIAREEFSEARAIDEALAPLSNAVTIEHIRYEKDENDTPIKDKVRNPVPVKAMMYILGMISSPFCRQPLGKLHPNAVEKIKEALTAVWDNNPKILQPIEGFFKVSISERIKDKSLYKELIYVE